MVRANQTAAFPSVHLSPGEKRQLPSQRWHDCGFLFGEGLPTLRVRGPHFETCLSSGPSLSARAVFTPRLTRVPVTAPPPT